MTSNDAGLSYYWWHANSLPPVRECSSRLGPGRYYFREKNPTGEAANAASRPQRLRYLEPSAGVRSPERKTLT